MPYPTTRTESGVPAEQEILRSNNVAEVLLADDVVYGHAFDALKYTKKDERFHALMKFEDAILGTEKDPMPTINVRYELWRLDKDKLEHHLRKDTIGMCQHTMDTYKELENVGIVTNVENREWRHYTDSQKIVELHRCEANGRQMFGFCETCEAQWRAEGGLHANLLKHYVNKKRYVHPFIRSRKDELDDLVVTEKEQFDYARFRLVLGLATCIVGNEKPLIAEVESCYVRDSAKASYKLSSYGVLDRKRLDKIQSERFKNFVLFDTRDPIHQNKKRSKDIDISGVEQRKLKSLLVREELHSFEVKYSKLRQRRGLEKLASLRLGGYTEDEVELFCIGASDVEVAKKWRETVSSEIPTKLEPKIEYQSGVKQLDGLIAAIEGGKFDGKLVDIYPAAEQAKGEAGEEFTCKWENVFDVSEQDDEAAYMCISHPSFPCNVRDVRYIVAGMRNYYITLDRREQDEFDFDAVDLDDFRGFETKIPVFEQELFGNSLIALDVNFGPPGDKIPFGVVKQSSLVTARVRSQYEPGFPILPYRFMPTFGKYTESAKTVADAVYTFGHRWLVGGTGNAKAQTTWDRWFAVRKGFWMEKTLKDDIERDGVRATWTNTARNESDKVVEQRKTWLEEAHVAQLGFMYLKADDTTEYVKTKNGRVPHSYVIRQVALASLHKCCIPISSAAEDMIEAKALSLANVGHNTQFWSIRTGALEALVDMLSGLSKRKNDDVANCVSFVCEAIDKLLLGVRAQIFTVAALKWSLAFFTSTIKAQSVLSGESLNVLEQYLQTWRMFLPVIEKAEVPSAMRDSERAQYENEKAKFFGLAQQINAQGFTSRQMETALLGDDVLNVVVANIIREKGSKNKTIENRLEGMGLSTVVDVLKVGVLAAQVEDYTSKIAFFVTMNKDNWTCLPNLEITSDKITTKLLQRSIKCLRTPLSGQFLYQLEPDVQETEE